MCCIFFFFFSRNRLLLPNVGLTGCHIGNQRRLDEIIMWDLNMDLIDVYRILKRLVLISRVFVQYMRTKAGGLYGTHLFVDTVI